MSGMNCVQGVSSGWSGWSGWQGSLSSSASAAASVPATTTAPTDPTAPTTPAAPVSGSQGCHGTSATAGSDSQSNAIASLFGSGAEDLLQQMSQALEDLANFAAQLQQQLSSLFSGQAPATSTDPTTAPVTTTTTPTTTDGSTTTTPTSGSQVSILDIRARERLSLDFVTQEGDVVHIRFGVRAHFVGAQDGSGNSASGATVDGKFSVSVKGDLNAQELAAIESVLQQVEGSTQQFFSGDAQAASTAASGITMDSSELASVNVRASERIQATYLTMVNSATADNVGTDSSAGTQAAASTQGIAGT